MIKKRNLDPSLLWWIMMTTGLGPSVGKVRSLVPDSSATAQYRAWLQGMGIPEEEMFTTLAEAEESLVAHRNDVLLVYPSDYTMTEKVTWDKSQTHMVGLAGPNLRIQPSTLTAGGLRFKTVTADVDFVLQIEGNYCQFHGIGAFNNGADVDNLGDIGIVGKNCYFRRCDFRGGNNATQNQAATPFAGVPVTFLSGAGYGNGTMFEECQLGSAGNTIRTAGPGCMLFKGSAGSQSFNVKLKRCTLEMWCETTGSANVGAIMEIGTSFAIDRYLEIDDCLLYNFWTNHGGKVDYAIPIPAGSPTTHDVIIRKSTIVGFDFWSNNATFVLHDMPAPADTGGIAAGVDVS